MNERMHQADTDVVDWNVPVVFANQTKKDGIKEATHTTDGSARRMLD